MGKVATGLSMSLDGFIAGPNDAPKHPLGEGGERLFNCYSSGDTQYRLPGTELLFEVSQQSAELLREAHAKMGALLTGRRTFDITGGWGGNPPVGVLPTFVLTHTPLRRGGLRGGGISFHVRVTEGVQRAVEQSREVAGEKEIAVGAASIVQQCIRAGLLEEIHIDLVSVLLGDGVRLFDHLGAEPVELERTEIIEAPDVTHMTFRVIR